MTMSMSIASMTFGGFLWAASTSGVPTFDTRSTCAGADAIGLMDRTSAHCMQSERQAHETLASRWASFPTNDRKRCIAETGIGGFPSYVQVLVCLELLDDSRRLKSQ